MVRKIGVLTSGGDAPGMNAAIRSVTRIALNNGVEVVGVRDGYRGLLDANFQPLERTDVSDILDRGGTKLGSARLPEFKEEDVQNTCINNLKNAGIDALVVIGGDGSYRGALAMTKKGINCIGLPGTIDNDVWGTDYTIGSDTAANTIIDAINKLRDTASAHRRIVVLEVMGRRCGWLAMVSGISGGAEYVLVPEEPFDIDEICQGIKDAYANGKKYCLVVVAEGAGSGMDIGKQIADKTGIDTRVSVLGHIQRGGSPSVADRVKASQLGEQAALALISGLSNVVFGFNQGKVVNIDLLDAVTNKKKLDPEYVRLARILS